MRRRHPIGRLCVITDTVVQSRFSHTELAELACGGGADIIQLRDKELGDDEMVAIGRQMRRLCDLHGAILIVNDRVAVARECRAHGVHLGRGDMSVEEARGILGEDAVIGTTAHSMEEALEADRSSADYAGFGHIFATSSKAKDTPPVGIEQLARVCASVSIPILAIGGITRERVAAVMHAGARGVAVIAEVCRSPDPRGATRRIRNEMELS